MMRRVLDRLRTSRAGVLYHRLDGTSEEDGRPWMMAPADARFDVAPDVSPMIEAEAVGDADIGAEIDVVGQRESDIGIASVDATAMDTTAMDTTAMDTTAMDTTAMDTTAADPDPGLVPALNRVADAFERMAASIEVEHRERDVRLDAVEQLLRELVTGLAQPTAVPPVVVGGSISLDMLHDDPDGEVAIDLADPQLELEGSDDAAGDAGQERHRARRSPPVTG